MHQTQTILITLLDTMLITLECILFALQAVAAVRLALESPFESASQSNNRLSKRSPVVLGGGDRKCYRMKSNVNGINLNLRVESAFSDIIVPLPSSSNNIGLAIQSVSSGDPVTIKYKGDEYKGISSKAVVTIPGTRITDSKLPVIAVKKQSPDLIGISPNLDGVFGIGYSSLSKHHPPATAMDILYNGNTIPNNEVGLQLCPYDMISNSFINIGNTDITAKCGTNGRSVAWVDSPSDGYFSVNIKSILINGEQVDLPAEFQKRILKNGYALYSRVETCFTFMQFPERVVATLIDVIVGSNAIIFKKKKLSDKLNKEMVKRKLRKNRPIFKSNYNIDWSKLPTVSIVMFSQNPVTDENRNSVVTIKLGPKDYIQIIDSKHVRFTVKVGSSDHAILGISFMTRLLLTFDRAHKRIGFAPGCGCETATDGYPIISNSDQVLWSPSQLPEQPSTSSSSGRSGLRRSLLRLGSTLRDNIRRGNDDPDYL
ncbi:hypothetical protein BATDEDRAFT_27069 [Batrachochytrium dendrobatidis JAM81]|uniref:Peptidase A1 domain-containing protein n=1 Tax=Batrachochytrium dendrobatidis (strain JAM81 / FGSC 10211) TaxID=684364 RepID=F4P9N0_BATDJ|nr:uncharacterized protein BATDEDRAFT_27069 [Batrachochytrium dendrobatidis JAM81]EGF77948.1 hypothetical protein BATDEDRAFT_27069 [Batrachochytrium dendrobatidis JAM81]|eukprot:XP_006681365.1 hypothetical protein BATDEDRAFT_27069 [Batrachochytrium dendrobatidis JAM81]